jgi:hypothetical protein
MTSIGLGWLRTAITLGVTALPISAATACGDSDASLGGNAGGTCEGQNWRQPTPGSVVCPGAPGCACADGEVCCVEVVNNKATGGSCGQLAHCPGPALRCDGSEDCAAGQVCCLIDRVGGGADCREPKDCFFSDEITLCRDDAECDGIRHCEPSRPGSYLAGVVAGCVL